VSHETFAQQVADDDQHDPHLDDRRDPDDEDEDDFDCFYIAAEGVCGAAGSEDCEFRCPYREDFGL
jgi:hypothetical protein